MLSPPLCSIASLRPTFPHIVVTGRLFLHNPTMRTIPDAITLPDWLSLWALHGASFLSHSQSSDRIMFSDPCRHGYYSNGHWECLRQQHDIDVALVCGDGRASVANTAGTAIAICLPKQWCAGYKNGHGKPRFAFSNLEENRLINSRPIGYFIVSKVITRTYHLPVQKSKIEIEKHLKNLFSKF